MNETKHIEQALRRFYQGLSSPEEQIELYLMLCDEPDEASYATDKALLATLLGLAAESSESQEQEALAAKIDAWQAAETKPRIELASSAQKKKLFWQLSRSFQYAAAAVLTLTLLVSSKWGITERKEKTLSFINNQLLDQEQVNQQASMAVAMLERFVSINMEAQLRASLEESDQEEIR